MGSAGPDPAGGLARDGRPSGTGGRMGEGARGRRRGVIGAGYGAGCSGRLPPWPSRHLIGPARCHPPSARRAGPLSGVAASVPDLDPTALDPIESIRSGRCGCGSGVDPAPRSGGRSVDRVGWWIGDRPGGSGVPVAGRSIRGRVGSSEVRSGGSRAGRRSGRRGGGARRAGAGCPLVGRARPRGGVPGGGPGGRSRGRGGAWGSG